MFIGFAQSTRCVCAQRTADGSTEIREGGQGLRSRLPRQELPPFKSRLPGLWTHSYFISVVGGAPLAIWKQYIENQRHV